MIGWLASQGRIETENAYWLLSWLPYPSWARDQVESLIAVRNIAEDKIILIERLIEWRADGAVNQLQETLSSEAVAPALAMIASSQRPRKMREIRKANKVIGERLNEKCEGYQDILIWEAGVKDFVNDDREQCEINLRLAIAFLKETLGPPPQGSELKVVWAYYVSQFPCVALAFTQEPAGASEYAFRAEKALMRFDEAVQWRNISRKALADVISGALDTSRS